MDVYGSLSSVQPVNKCASSAILPPDYLNSSSTAFLGQPEGAPKKKFPTALVVGGLIVGGVVLYYASKVGGTLAANPRCRLEVKQHPDGSWGVAQNGRMFPRKFERKSDAIAWRGGMGNECVPGYAANPKARKKKLSEREQLQASLARQWSRSKLIEDVAPLVRAAGTPGGRPLVFLVNSRGSASATERMIDQSLPGARASSTDSLSNAKFVSSTLSYAGILAEATGRPLVFYDAQESAYGNTLFGLVELREKFPRQPVLMVGFAETQEDEQVVKQAAAALGARLIRQEDSRWYEYVPGPVSNPRSNNDSYSPFPVEQIPGGRAAGMRPSDFDPVELARGAEHELEHTDDWRVAREIAQDHLIEDSAYYEKLDAMERGEFRDNPKLQWQGSGSGSWARARGGYSYYRLLQRAPGEWLVYFDDVVVGAERTPALAKKLAQEHAARRDNPSFKATCVKDCHATFGKNNKPAYLKKCLAACHGVLLGKGLADLPKGA